MCETALPVGTARRVVLRACGSGALVLSMLAAVAPAAHAQGKLEARYTASLAGIPIGKGSWTVEIRDGQYSAAAEGRVIGLLRLLGKGEGFAAANGTLTRGRLSPVAFTSRVISSRRASEVHMALASGAVTELEAEPMPPTPDRVPLTEAHRHGIIDPMSAALVTVGGSADPLSPDACRHTLPIFDGYQRFDLALSFKRMDEGRMANGYHGPVVVCSVAYQPIAGHRPARYAIKYLMEQRDIEIWFAPIAGTRVLAPFRVSVPTTLGSAVLQATQFEAARAGLSDAKTQ